MDGRNLGARNTSEEIQGGPTMATVSVRYIVDDVEAAIAFYTERLGFGVEFNPPGFAVLSRDDLRLLLNEPGAGGAGQPMPDGRKPKPGCVDGRRVGSDRPFLRTYDALVA
jgi:catechol 2,3-dioxygenase-like lactoylglutathione lyase family enzyme